MAFLALFSSFLNAIIVALAYTSPLFAVLLARIFFREPVR